MEISWVKEVHHVHSQTEKHSKKISIIFLGKIKMRPWNLTKQNLPFLIEKINNLDYNKRWKIVIYEESEKRSNEQNERLWGYLYPSIGNYLGLTQREIHNMCKYQFLRSEMVINDEVITVLKSTTKLSVKEFTDYMEKVEMWAGQQGWSGE